MYQCILAYGVASIVYVIGSLIGGASVATSGMIIAVLSAIILCYLLFMKDPFFQNRESDEEASAA